MFSFTVFCRTSYCLVSSRTIVFAFRISVCLYLPTSMTFLDLQWLQCNNARSPPVSYGRVAWQWDTIVGNFLCWVIFNPLRRSKALDTHIPHTHTHTHRHPSMHIIQQAITSHGIERYDSPHAFSTQNILPTHIIVQRKFIITTLDIIVTFMNCWSVFLRCPSVSFWIVVLRKWMSRSLWKCSEPRFRNLSTVYSMIVCLFACLHHNS